ARAPERGGGARAAERGPRRVRARERARGIRRLALRQRRHGRRPRRRPRGAAARGAAGGGRRAARRAGAGRRRARPCRGGVRMGELRTWEQLPPGGAVRSDEAAHARTGGWRTGLKPSVDRSRCVNCLLCWLYCPDSAVLLDGETFTGFDYDYCKGCEI